jgi:hypothetical protein
VLNDAFSPERSSLVIYMINVGILGLTRGLPDLKLGYPMSQEIAVIVVAIFLVMKMNQDQLEPLGTDAIRPVLFSH